MKAKYYWSRAIKIIPGGNGLLSKRPNRFLPDGWPIYYSKAKGINIWDLQNKKYIDFSIMGVGTAILGYANSEIDNKVSKFLKRGVNTTLNCLEEFLLAKKILKYDQFADQVKFARGGGEAMSIATRIARSQSKNIKIAFSGYHGWHDWYLAANLKNKKNLNNHLLKDLDPKGVPKGLKNTVIPFEFNDSLGIEKICKKNKLAAIVIEGARATYPSKEFIKKINYLKNKYKICLIIDEITSGWRERTGGIYKKVGLKPDIVVYGKALGNGYAISAIVGKKKFMNKVQDSFVSSTAWTERVGFISAISTIDYFIKNKVGNTIKKNGKYLLNGWKKIAKKNDLKINFNEFLGMPSFSFNYGVNSEKLHTYFTELMLAKGYLATNGLSITYAHKKKDIDAYLKNCDKTFEIISKSVKENNIKLKSEVRVTSYQKI
jgi:glutamate-1-semialdehyde 2,1-aminomutase